MVSLLLDRKRILRGAVFAIADLDSNHLQTEPNPSKFCYLSPSFLCNAGGFHTNAGSNWFCVLKIRTTVTFASLLMSHFFSAQSRQPAVLK